MEAVRLVLVSILLVLGMHGLAVGLALLFVGWWSWSESLSVLIILLLFLPTR